MNKVQETFLRGVLKACGDQQSARKAALEIQ